jgi:hypothetical protein
MLGVGKGHFTNETKGPWPLHCKIFYGQKGRGHPSSLHIRGWRPKGPKENIYMDEKSTWIPTRKTPNIVSWFVGNCVRPTSHANFGKPCWWYTLWIRIKAPHITWSQPWLVCEVALSIGRKPHPWGGKKLSWKWLRSISYTSRGSPQHWFDSGSLIPQSNPTFSTLCGPHFAACKVMRPDFRSLCSRGENAMKIINLSWTDKKNVHYPMNEPNPTHVESSGRRKSSSRFLQASPKVWRQHCAT